jgi:hypothetical protein
MEVATQRGRFRFDTGPSLLLFKEVYEEVGTFMAKPWLGSPFHNKVHMPVQPKLWPAPLVIYSGSLVSLVCGTVCGMNVVDRMLDEVWRQLWPESLSV